MFGRIVVTTSLAAAVLCTGCASIVSGHNQSVSVKTTVDGANVDGAKCSLSNDKGSWYATTPASVVVRRSFQDLVVACSLANADPASLSVKSSTQAMAFGNILFGGVIGASVDIASGAAYDYPNLISVPMPAKAVARDADRSPTLAPSPSDDSPIAPGALLTFEEFEQISGASQGETSLTVTTRSPDKWVFNEGSIIAKADGTPVKSSTHGSMVYGAGLTDIANGGSWTGALRAAGVADDVPVTLTMLGKEHLVVSGQRFDVAKLRITGYATRSYISGGASSQIGAPVEGEMLVDLGSGLTLSVRVKSRHPSYVFHRTLVRFVRAG